MDMILSDITYFAVFIASAVLGVFGVRIDEESAHEVLLKEGRFEVRRYLPRLTASVAMADGNPDKAFRRLAGYILGANGSKGRIAMTAPVVMPEKARVAMTVPVLMGGDKPEMTFSMPRRWTMATLPKPDDPGILLREEPERVVASVRFRGRMTDAVAAERRKELVSWLGKNGWRAASGARQAAYDPPFSVPLLRRNEVHVDAVRAEAAVSAQAAR